MCHSRNDADSTKFIIIGCIGNDTTSALVQARDMSKFTAEASKHFSRRVQTSRLRVQTSRRRVQNLSPTRPNVPPTRPKLPADASKLPADASKVSRQRDYLILDASASRVGYAADATRNRLNMPEYNLCEPNQSAYKPNHSVETAINCLCTE